MGITIDSKLQWGIHIRILLSRISSTAECCKKCVDSIFILQKRTARAIYKIGLHKNLKRYTNSTFTLHFGKYTVCPQNFPRLEAIFII